MIDLNKFCCDTRKEIMRPWTRGEFTYATNGHIIVRVPAINEIGCCDGAPDAGDRLSWGTPQVDAVDIPELPAPEIIDCPWCTGPYPDDDTEDCDQCGRTGKIRKVIPVQVGNMTYSDEYLGLIKDLPGLKFYPVFHDYSKVGTPSNKSAAYFSFDGGEGLLMPRKP